MFCARKKNRIKKNYGAPPKSKHPWCDNPSVLENGGTGAQKSYELLANAENRSNCSKTKKWKKLKIFSQHFTIEQNVHLRKFKKAAVS